MSNRRTKNIAGYVKFPVDDPKWEHTHEGGMFVRLVSVPPSDYNQREVMCCGGTVSFLYDESFVGDDVILGRERDPILGEGEGRLRADKFHFPNIDAPYDPDGVEPDARHYVRYMSREYNAVILMGSTGWSGWGGDELWRCTYADLTDEGKKIYDMVAALYPNSKNYLQTWLDT